MIKRIMAIALSAFLLFTSTSMASFSDVSTGSKYADAINNLTNLGILSGYGDGTFGATKSLTRSQFAKLIVIMSGNKDKAVSKNTEVFSDVSSNYWGVGYINEAAELGLITGYPDGRFAPDDEITYAQAITVVIRMLGYSASDVGTNWPADYITKAAELDLTEGLTFNNSDVITREVAAYILNNALTAKNGTNSSVSSLTKVENVVVYGNTANNASIAVDEVMTSGGTYKKGLADIDSYIGMKVTIWVNKSNEIDMVQKVSQDVKTYTLNAAYADKMETLESGLVDVDGNKIVYYKGAKTNYSAVYSTLLSGSTIKIYDDYIFIEEKKLDGPYTITSNYSQVNTFFGKLDNVNVTRDGEAALLTDIEKFDVVYYNDVTNRLYVYSDKVTGIYEKALPSKDNLTGITLSGTTYSSFSVTAKQKLDDTAGSFQINDRITLLFGNDGSVVDVVDLDGQTLSDMGVLLSIYTSYANDDDEAKGEKQYYANIMLASGKEVAYRTDKEYKDTDYTKYIGSFVYIENQGDGIMSLKLAPKNPLEGTFDKSIPSYAGCEFQQNYSILELVYLEDGTQAMVQKVNLKDITGSSLTDKQVIHVEYANGLKDIAVLYIKDTTYSGYTYGILSDSEIKDGGISLAYSATYDIVSNSGENSYTTSFGYSYSEGSAVMAIIYNGKMKAMKTLNEAETGKEIQEYTNTKIKMNDNVYRMDEDVTVVYKQVGKDWQIIKLDDIANKNVSSIGLYTDTINNGTVRVIKVFGTDK
ncbi:MAG: S-layer homology domain-containing protein [Bacillota bacterium]|nr:S-layer homology domain-containing protein [Bacillota bacterium]